LGIIGAQGLLTLGDVSGATLFIGASILVSISFGPILLSVTPVPVAEITRAMPLRELFTNAPLGTVGIFLLGSVYATQSGMGAVFGTRVGMSTDEIVLFIAMLFAGALFLQYPIGWVSDRMDRRALIFIVALLGGAFCNLGWAIGANRWIMDLSRFDAAPLIAFTATKETDYGTETDGRIPSSCGAYRADQWAYT